MQCLELTKEGRKVVASLKPEGWGESYRMLHEQTPVSLYALAAVEGADNFDNPCAIAMQGLYDRRTVNVQKLRNEPFALITRDVIREGGRGINDKGRLHLRATSFDGIRGWQKTKYVWSPKPGYPVPTDDSDGTFAGLFHEGTPVAIETLPFEKRREAVKKWKAKGLDPKYLSGYFVEERIDKNTNDGVRFVGRDFDPDVDENGRFDVYLDRLPSNSGDDLVASLPAYGKAEIVGRAELAA